jgi:hypothetical protein
MGQIWALFRNHGNSFRYSSAVYEIRKLSRTRSGWSNGFIDYNNDGWKDIYSSNGDVDQVNDKSAQHDTMFENVDGKSFMDVSGRWAAFCALVINAARLRRFQQRRSDGYRRHRSTNAPHPPQLERERQSLADAAPHGRQAPS